MRTFPRMMLVCMFATVLVFALSVGVGFAAESAETTSVVLPPEPPFVKTPAITSFSSTNNAVTLEWAAKQNYEYIVEMKTTGKYAVVLPYTPDISSATIKNLKTGVPYTFRIRARLTIDEVTGYSDYSLPQIVRTGPKIFIYLTFDDGPSTKSTPKILKILAQHGIKATFFMTGGAAQKNKAVARTVYQRGHTIANHSYSHNYQKLYASPAAFMNDIARSERAIQQVIGTKPSKVIRFPGGSTMGILQRNPGTLAGIKARVAKGGYQYFDWNVSLADSRMKAPKKNALSNYAIRQIKSNVKAGKQHMVVLAHDTNSRPWTPQEIPRVIKYCESQGFYFATLTTKSPACKFR